ncbi:unnamed protein product, partial [Schistosoma turkestanicum]
MQLKECSLIKYHNQRKVIINVHKKRFIKNHVVQSTFCSNEHRNNPPPQKKKTSELNNNSLSFFSTFILPVVQKCEHDDDDL